MGPSDTVMQTFSSALLAIKCLKPIVVEAVDVFSFTQSYIGLLVSVSCASLGVVGDDILDGSPDPGIGLNSPMLCLFDFIFCDCGSLIVGIIGIYM